MDDRVRALALSDGRFSPEAFRFLVEGLEHSIVLSGRGDREGQERHVTGREVLTGLVDYARKLFGPLAGQVWQAWGIERALDWGTIVFLLVDNGFLSRQESDTIEDFRVDLDFESEFGAGYQVELPQGF
jgi:uncharacterized repeat protein (TIGR04138 family)